MFIVALSAAAQDDVPGPSNTSPISNSLFNQDAPIYDEKPLLMEQTAKPVVTDTLQHKVVPVPAAKAKATATDSRKPQAEGDPLNFNFLYYIIQKFKASELMME